MPENEQELRHDVELWTAAGFVKRFKLVTDKIENRSFAFLLGAGCSVTSGIPAGGKLAHRWLQEMYDVTPEKRDAAPDQRPEDGLRIWATAANLDIDNFAYDRAAEFYAQIYDRRFGDDPEKGYAYLQNEMQAAKPSFGYAVLSQLLTRTRHNVVITTNFDDLAADALAIYTPERGFVCGHESLAPFIDPQPTRPLIAKVHRDLLLGPQNTAADTILLHTAWDKALRAILKNHSLVVIGYGGNDGSVMNFLTSLPAGAIPGGIYWCYRSSNGLPEQRIQRLVARQKGKLVEIDGFDELMLLFFAALEKFKFLYKPVQDTAKERAKAYLEKFEKLKTSLDQQENQTDLLREFRESLYKKIQGVPGYDWQDWVLRADSENDPEKKENIYRDGMAMLPNSFELAGAYATFLTRTRRNPDEAERLFKKVLAGTRGSATITGNFAFFLMDIRKDHDGAERLFEKAMKLDPLHANNASNYAFFLTHIRGKHDEAERLFRKTLELDPKHANCIGNFAWFLTSIRRNHDEAERLFKRALELDPRHAGNTGGYALLLANVRKDYEEAERLFKKALELDPNDANNTGNYACFLWQLRRNDTAAEILYTTLHGLRHGESIDLANQAAFRISQGLFGKAAALLNEAREGLSEEPSQTLAEVFLYEGLLAKIHEQDDILLLTRLAGLLDVGFERMAWNFDRILEMTREKLAPQDHALYSAIAAAILDPNKIADLSKITRWREITGQDKNTSPPTNTDGRNPA